ncbi:hypothetical protein H2201_009315, partial [Coniosporium apollinis]
MAGPQGIVLTSDDEDTGGTPRATTPVPTPAGIYALDFVSAEHPLLPPDQHLRITNAADARSRFRSHSDFWFDVMVAMQQRAHPEPDPGRIQELHDDIRRYIRENEQLRQ